MAMIARLGVVLGLDSAEFTKGIERAKQGVKSFASDTVPLLKNAALIGAAAFTGMTYKALQLADQISDLAAASELSVASVLKISDAFQQSGGQYDQAGKAIQKFSEVVDNAAKGSLELQKAFGSVGISLSDLETMSVEQLFYKSVDGVSKLSDSATRAGTKMDLFGKAMRNIDMGGFNDQLKEGTGEFDDYAASIKAAADLSDKLEKKSRDLVLIFVKELGPTLDRIFDTINRKGGMAEKVFGGIKNIILDVWYGAGALAIQLQKVELFFNNAFSRSPKQYFEQIDALNKELEALRENVYGLNNIPTLSTVTVTDDSPSGRRTVTPGKDPAAEQEKKIQAMIRMANLNANEFDREQKHSYEMAAAREHMNSLTNDQRKIQESVNEVLDATSKKIKEITDKREEAVSKEADPRIIAAYDEQILKIQELGNEWATLTGEQTIDILATQKSFSYGWERAFAQYAEDSENYATMAGDMFQAVTGAMSRAIDNFVDNGKFSFKDFAGSIIKDLIKIELKMQAMQLFRMGIGAIMGSFGGGLGGASVSGIGTTAGGEGAMAFPVNLGGAANGGTITGATLVGERGPELFVPGRSGAIIPNNNMGSALGGTTYVTNNYIDAIDTKSFEDRVLSSHNAVWAANQYANKSLQVGRGRT
jgi:lambda family phage tail tape measure protein